MSGCKTLRYFSALNSSLLTDIAVKSLCHSKRLQVLKLEGQALTSIIKIFNALL